MKKTIYVFNDGEFKRKDNTIHFETQSGKTYLPIEDVSDIFIFGEVNLNKKFLELMSQKEIILHFFNYHGYYTGSYYPREHLNSGYMILRQAEHYLDQSHRLNLARSFVQGSVSNMINVIRYYSNRGRDLSAIEDGIQSLECRVENCSDISELMGIEGNIRDYYYKSFDIILQDSEFSFDHRTKRPPQNQINAMISFGNSMLYTLVLGEIYKTHLDPRIGFLHSTNFRRFTLNLDIAEVFKPIIVDRVIFTLIGKKMLNDSDFDREMGGIIMKESGRKTFIEEFDKKLRTTIKHRKLGREVSYRRLIRMELYKLEKHLMGEEEYRPYVSRW
jgi:CRISPR-associated protein Cas1